MQCFVYRSTHHPDTYVYLPAVDDFAILPEALRRRLGKLELAMNLELSNDRKLARVSAATVLQAIAEHGYYLQLPPGDGLSRDYRLR